MRGARDGLEIIQDAIRENFQFRAHKVTRGKKYAKPGRVDDTEHILPEFDQFGLAFPFMGVDWFGKPDHFAISHGGPAMGSADGRSGIIQALALKAPGATS